MKKLVSFAFSALLAASLQAEDASDVLDNDENDPIEHPQPTYVKRESHVWPSFFAICEYPANPDVTGLRLTIPFSTVQENVTGIDLGLWGRTLYFQGFQFNLLRNDVKDELSGFQLGLYNSVGDGQLLGVQVGLINEANTLRGVQAGLINLSGEVQGLQVGLINRTETMSGYQIGLINVIRDAELQFFPIVNIGW